MNESGANAGLVWIGGRLACAEVLELSRLALRRRLAPLVNFSCQLDPTFKDSSVIGTQSGQHARRGTV